ncbi:MAG: hypothetical protein [Bacteriophage sp.]|nr:MAG: hypothetical protein [Bacteriophage sp.]
MTMKLSDIITAAGGAYELSMASGIPERVLNESRESVVSAKRCPVYFEHDGETFQLINTAGIFTVFRAGGDVSWMPHSVGLIPKPFLSVLKSGEKIYHHSLAGALDMVK